MASRKPRKKHLQTSIVFTSWGGKRENAGRPPATAGSKQPHTKRTPFSKLTPVHVTLRVVDRIKTLRSRAAYVAIRKATAAMLARADFRIVHVSPERDHLHLIVEADNDVALANGIRAFQSSAAQHLNRAVSPVNGPKVRGKVFDDRYNSKLIGSPTQARHCIAYVLNNWRRHDQDEVSVEVRVWDVDYYSSAVSFDGWLELSTKPFLYNIAVGERLCVATPQSWLLSVGWRKAGTISMYQVPGPRRRSVKPRRNPS